MGILKKGQTNCSCTLHGLDKSTGNYIGSYQIGPYFHVSTMYDNIPGLMPNGESIPFSCFDSGSTVYFTEAGNIDYYEEEETDEVANWDFSGMVSHGLNHFGLGRFLDLFKACDHLWNQIKDFGQKALDVGKTGIFAPARLAFLGLMELNFRNLAYWIWVGVAKPEELTARGIPVSWGAAKKEQSEDFIWSWRATFGGDESKLIAACEHGSKKPMLGFDGDTQGFDLVSGTTMTAAMPILLKVLPLLLKEGSKEQKAASVVADVTNPAGAEKAHADSVAGIPTDIITKTLSVNGSDNIITDTPIAQKILELQKKGVPESSYLSTNSTGYMFTDPDTGKWQAIGWNDLPHKSPVNVSPSEIEAAKKIWTAAAGSTPEAMAKATGIDKFVAKANGLPFPLPKPDEIKKGIEKATGIKVTSGQYKKPAPKIVPKKTSTTTIIIILVVTGVVGYFLYKNRSSLGK